MVGTGRRARRCYGFDEVALVPGAGTINPNEVDTSWAIAGKNVQGPHFGGGHGRGWWT